MFFSPVEDRERILQELAEERKEKQSLQDKLINIEKDPSKS